MHTVEPIRWTSDGVVLLDQRRLPSEVIHHTYTDYRELAAAIKNMVIRGAPAIGVTAAMGIALGVQNSQAKSLEELRTEFRSRELLATTVVFILTIIVLFSFTFDPSVTESRRFGPGLLWLAFLFAASLMLQPCFLREQNNDTLSALRLSVSDPFAIFLAKLSANTLFLLFTQVLLLPVFSILYNVPVLAAFPQLVLVMFMGSLGLSVTGTALSAISAQARMRELLLPLLLLPLLTPVLIASTEATAALLVPNPIMPWKWLGFLLGFDVVFLTALWLFGEYLLEE